MRHPLRSFFSRVQASLCKRNTGVVVAALIATSALSGCVEARFVPFQQMPNALVCTQGGQTVRVVQGDFDGRCTVRSFGNTPFFEARLQKGGNGWIDFGGNRYAVNCGAVQGPNGTELSCSARGDTYGIPPAKQAAAVAAATDTALMCYQMKGTTGVNRLDPAAPVTVTYGNGMSCSPSFAGGANSQPLLPDPRAQRYQQQPTYR